MRIQGRIAILTRRAGGASPPALRGHECCQKQVLMDLFQVEYLDGAEKKVTSRE